VTAAVFRALSEQGAREQSAWIYGPPPIKRLRLDDGLHSDDVKVLFIYWIESENGGAWRTLLQAIQAGVAAEGIGPDTVLLVLDATPAARGFWERAGFQPFVTRAEALALYDDFEEGFTPMRARLTALSRPRRRPKPRSRKKNPDAKAVLRRAMRGT
jgi:hypothetical protein